VNDLSPPLSTAALFRPFCLKTLSVRNRLAMAPMTRHTAPNGVPGPDFGDFYSRRAEGGIGLIVCGAIYVDHPQAGDDPMAPRLDAETLEPWRRVVDGIHAAGSRTVAELWHIGIPTTRRPDGFTPMQLLGPSGISSEGVQVSEPMSLGDIESIIAGFARSARLAKAAGFDGIDIHCAHGYLLDQFLWERTNRRTDAYGGDAIGRTRMAADIVRACRVEVGADFPIFLRFSQWKNADYNARIAATPGELARVLEKFVDAGVDLFDCSTRRFWQPEFPDSDLNLAGWARKLTGKPTMTVGSVGMSVDVMQSLRPDGSVEDRSAGLGNIARLVEMLERGDFDLVALARPLLADPDWGIKVARGDIAGLIPFDRAHLRVMYPVTG
jgi:2,4-dienoyl-CoA reductase-like NADH-dependent reductase (Old Yellow Enzyme family)